MKEPDQVKLTTVLATTAAVAGAVLSAPIAHSDNPSPMLVPLGQSAELVHGPVVQAWTVKDLKPSSDVIPYPVRGVLWEATATDTAIAGSVTPIVSNFNARAGNGDTYRVLFGAATPQGVNPATLAQGQHTTGTLYFDVTDAQPDSLVYNDGARDLAIWVTPAAPPAGSSPSYRPGPVMNPGRSQDSAAAEAARPPEGETPIAPAPASNPENPLPTTSFGTPLPGSAGTPLPAEGTTPGVAPTPATTPSAAAGTPVPTGPPAPAAAPTVPTTVPAGSAGTPLSPVTVPPAAPSPSEASPSP